ncbi:MAG: cytochrome b [bacterium]
MALRDSENSYGWLTIVLHWVTAATVITLYVLGEMAEDAGKEERMALLGLHISIAMSLYLILWFRIFWRARNIRPLQPDQHRALKFLAQWVPVILLTALALMLISGPLMVWTKGSPIHVFDALEIATPFGEIEWAHELAETIHKASATVIYFCFFLHLAGAIKHLIIDRDDTFSRMIKPRSPQSESTADSREAS